MTNGFAVTSPDGARLNGIETGVQGSLEGLSNFGEMLNFGAPATADNLGFFAFSPLRNVLDPLASDAYFVITLEPLSVDYIGRTLVIDSTTFGHLGYWEWYVDGLTPVIPDWGGPYTFAIGEPDYLAGDVNNSGSVNVGDVSTMVNFMFLGGEVPEILEACDVNGDCEMSNVADLTYQVDYLFRGGSSPQYSCSMLEKAAPLVTDIQLDQSHEDGSTIISIKSPVDLRGIQLELNSRVEGPVTSRVDEGIELIQGSVDGTTRIGLLDMEGIDVITAGQHRLIEVPGQVEVVSAVVSDINHRAYVAALVNSPVTVPADYALNQNYPNPFNPATVLSFTLPRSEMVHLEVFNIAGQQVTVLVNDHMEAGFHEVEFDGSDLASGVYLYRLTAGNFTETRKMLLLK
jgi:hypothetical protein